MANFLKGKSQGAREAIVVQNWGNHLSFEILHKQKLLQNKQI